MTRYWLAKISEEKFFYYAVERNLWLMQQQYNEQTNSAVTNIWSTVSEIKVGDYLMLGYGNTIHAIGKICTPRKIPGNKHSSNISMTIGENKHEHTDGFVVYEDSEVFYENLTDLGGDWGQRIDVEKWLYYSENGISNSGVKDGSTGGLAVYTIFEIQETYFKNKQKQLIAKYMETLSLRDKIGNTLEANKNIILTGAPGTGKTYLAKILAKKLILPSNLKEDVITKSIDPFLKQVIDIETLNRIDDSWLFWKDRIKAEDFNLDDFANTQANIAYPEKIKNGYYLMNFLEWKSTIYGSSKPGNAFNYGIKMNNDNKTYTIYDNKDQPVGKDIAEPIFNEKIKSWLKQFIISTLEEKINMAKAGNELIRAGQLLRKMIVLDHPLEFLSIYQDDTIKRAYDYFISGAAKTYYEQNKEVLLYLLSLFSLEKTKENQLRLTDYIWTYFNKNAKGNSESMEEEIKEKYFNDHCEFVQFHPSYDYTDFVEGLRPIKIRESELGFELRNGVFKQLCKKAVNDQTGAKYVIIIDEINRAEISKVFGELFFAIDPGYRGKKGMVKTQYSNMQNEDTCFISVEDPNFYVPDNVFIIGTMNDIDRSVETFDFAMRRRFTWIEIKANDRIEMLVETIPEWKDVAIRKMQALNTAIENIEGLNSSYHIGPAYFLKLKDYQGDFAQLWNYHLEPLVKEYLRGLPNAPADLKIVNEAFNNG